MNPPVADPGSRASRDRNGIGRGHSAPLPARARSRRSSVIRGLFALAVIGIWTVIASIGGKATGSLAEVQTNDQQAFLPAGAESVRAADQVVKFTGSTSLPAVVLFSTGGPVAGQTQRDSWASFVRTLPSLPVGRDGIAMGTVADYLLPGPRTLTPSQDRQAALVVVSLDSQKLIARAGDGRQPIGPVVQALRTAADKAAAGAQAHLTGPAGTIADLGTAFVGIDGLLVPVALGAVLLILFLVYRAVGLPFAVLLTSISGLALAGGIVYLLADHGVLQLNDQSQGILFILVVGAATDYGLLLVARYREELERTPSSWLALRRAWRACLEPIAASAGTVTIGLLCLLLSQLNSHKSLGPVAAIGVVSAFIAAQTLLPAILLTGRWLFWPRVPRFRPLPTRGGACAGDAGSGETQDRAAQREGRAVWTRVAVLVAKYPRQIWVVTALVLLAACAALPTLRASGTSQTAVFLDPVDSIAGDQALAAHFPGGSGNPVVIIAPQSAAALVLRSLGSVAGLAPDPPVLQAVSSTTPASGVGTPKVVDRQVLIQATLTAPSDSTTAQRTVRDIRSSLHALPGGDRILVGGSTATQLDSLANSERDLRVIIPAVLLAVLLVLIVLLRALVAPLLLVGATVLSFGAALGISALVFNHILNFPGADPSLPLFAFVFLVALGVDYSIFLMTRAREETALHGARDGMLRAVAVTGGVITSAGVVLASTFAALGIIPILFLAQIAFVVAFGVLLDTLVVRSLLVPALSMDLGTRTWWPGHPRPTGHQLQLLAEQHADRHRLDEAPAEPGRD